MRKSTIAAGVCAGFLVGTSAIAGDGRHLELRWCDPHGLLESGFGSVGKELVRIFKQADVAVALTREGEASAIRVVLVRSEPEAWGLPPNTMGAVLSQTGPQTEVYVFFRSVARVLGYRPEVLSNRWLKPTEERALSRALARVVAHEVIHAVRPAQPHGSVGLTRVTLDRATLLAADLTIEPGVARDLSATLLQRTSLPVQQRGPIDDDADRGGIATGSSQEKALTASGRSEVAPAVEESAMKGPTRTGALARNPGGPRSIATLIKGPMRSGPPQ